jgi:hypothetical protein
MKNIDQKIKSIQASIFSILEDYLPSYDEAGESETMQMTFSTCDNLEELNFQSGDNSFSGACYFHKHWAVTELSVDDNLEELSIDLAEQLADCVLIAR